MPARLILVLFALLLVPALSPSAQTPPGAGPPASSGSAARSSGAPPAGSSAAAGPATGAVKGALERHIVVSWKPVAGATKYEVLVRPLGGDTIIDQTTTATDIRAVLTPGTYQVRVISFDIFDKPASASPWHYLDVIRVYAPGVEKITPNVLYSGVAHARMVVTGSHFIPQTTVELTSGGEKVAAAAIDRQTGGRLELHFDLSQVSPGSYDLRVGNPEHLSLTLPAAVQVSPRIQPHLSSISLHEGYNDRVYRDVSVSGGGFIAGTRFSLSRGPHRVDIPAAKPLSESSERLNIDLGDLAPGRYDLVATDPGGLSATLPAAIEVQAITSPRFVSMKPTKFTIGRSAGRFVLKARDMIPGAHVVLRHEALLAPATAASPSSSGEERTFEFNLAALAPGSYDLLIENSRLLTTVVPDLVSIEARPVPALSASSVARGFNDRSYPKVVLSGENLLPSYRVVLEHGEVRYGLQSRFVSPQQIDYDLDLRGLAPGAYRLVVQSSARTVASLPGGIEVIARPQPQPSVSASSVTLAYDDRSYANATLTGEHFLPSYHVALERSNVLYNLTSRYVSPQRIEFDADLKGFSPGNYRLLLQDRLKTVASLAGGITVTDPPQRFFHPGWTAITVGYPYSLGLTDSFAQSVTGSRLAATAGVSFPAGERFFPQIPGVRDLRLGIDLGDLLFQNLAAASVSTLNLTTAGTDLTYRSPFNFPLNAVATMGYGLAYGAFSEPALGGSASGGSFAFYVSLGGGAEIDIGRLLVLEAGARWTRIYFPSANFDTLSPFIEGGVRLGGKPRPKP